MRAQDNSKYYGFALHRSHKSLVSIWPYLIISALLLLSVTSAGFAQWREDDREDDCIRYKGPKYGGVIPIKVVCVWPLTPQSVRKVLSKPEHYDRCLSRIESSELVSTSGQKLKSKIIRIYQVHNGSPASDRGLYLDYQLDQRDDHWRMSFKKSPADQVKPVTDHVEAKANRGYWEVKRHAQGVQVTLESLYDPGGSVPSFLVRWFISGGVQKMMNELRVCARRVQ